MLTFMASLSPSQPLSLSLSLSLCVCVSAESAPQALLFSEPLVRFQEASPRKLAVK
jgi:hypothetical protein